MENRSSGRRPHTPRADAHAVDQQRDADDALDRERGPAERMRMPHERDESPTASTSGSTMPTQQEVIGQAAEDLARGLTDTDCRNQPRADGSPCPPGPGAARGRSRASAASPARLGRAARRMRRAGA